MGFGELLLILIIVLVVFGSERLPEIGRGLGKGVSNFKEGLRKGKDDAGNKSPPANDQETPDR